MTDRHPTPDHYVEFYVAFTHFNLLLFESVLPNCLITMSRRGRGYFKAQAWLGRGRVTDEISLSPDQLGAPTLDTLAVLVHEMTHQWQAHFGAPTRSGYHNREWAARMETLGLIPSDTGRPGGKRTGQSMGHYVSDGGPFEQAAKALRGTGWEVPVMVLLQSRWLPANVRYCKTPLIFPKVTASVGLVSHNLRNYTSRDYNPPHQLLCNRTGCPGRGSRQGSC